MPARRLLALVVLGTLLALPTPAEARVGEGPGAGVPLRTYRLALLSDPSYAAAVAPSATTDAESDAQVLAAKQLLVDRLNQVYGAELAIRFTLAPGSSALNLRTAAEATVPGGPCGGEPCFTTAQLEAGCTDDLMARGRYVIGQLVGARHYEIGHVVLGATFPGTSYAASAGSEYRAYGCSGSAVPLGDDFAVGRLAHELGHQLGAGATFDATSCGEERNVDSAVEPGSGASVMSAAGTCGPDDLQSQREPWFASASVEEIGLYVTGQGPVPDDAIAAEVQSVALTGFDGADSFRLSFNGVQTAPITRGVNFTAAGVRAAVLAAVPAYVPSKVRPYWQSGVFDDRGFELTFASYTDVVEPTVVPVAGTFTAQVADIDAGGLQLPGGVVTASGNRSPVVTAPADRTIPLRTPFALTGSATDPDGDQLVHQWQQIDAGGLDGQSLRDAAKTDGPLFRTLAPVASPTRSFPDLAQVVAGGTNARTGSCSASDLECWAEWLPTASYTPAAMTFRLLARDRAAGGGGTAYDDVVLTVDKTTGPFRVTSDEDPGTRHVGGASRTVEWTPNTAHLAADVRISLSTDGGLTFPVVLAASTPNDGGHTVTLPSVVTSRARVRVEAVGNYFYDVSDADFAIEDPPPSSLTVSGVPDSATTQYSDPVDFSFTAESTVTARDEIGASLLGLPDGLTLTKTGPGAWSVTGTVDDDAQSYPLSLQVWDDEDSVLLERTVTVTPESATVVYDGDISVDEPYTDSGVRFSATVTQEDDGHLGNLAEATVFFTDALTGDDLCHAPLDTAGTGFCGIPAHGDRTWEVEARVEAVFAGTTAAPTTVVLRGYEIAETTLTSSPPRWLLAGSTRVSFSSSKPGSTFGCTLDTVALPCSTSPVTLTGLAAGSHRFTVAARDADGVVDPSPAVSTFTVPVDDRGLAVGAGTWRRKRAGAAYGGTYSTARAAKATLTYRVSRARSLALLVGAAPGQGKVKVFLGGTLLATVTTSGASSWRRLVPLASFTSPRSGVVRIVTTSAKPVRVDGLGVSTL